VLRIVTPAANAAHERIVTALRERAGRIVTLARWP
jgi:hypothetical protein